MQTKTNTQTVGYTINFTALQKCDYVAQNTYKGPWGAMFKVIQQVIHKPA